MRVNAAMDRPAKPHVRAPWNGSGLRWCFGRCWLSGCVSILEPTSTLTPTLVKLPPVQPTDLIVGEVTADDPEARRWARFLRDARSIDLSAPTRSASSTIATVTSTTGRRCCRRRHHRRRPWQRGLALRPWQRHRPPSPCRRSNFVTAKGRCAPHSPWQRRNGPKRSKRALVADVDGGYGRPARPRCRRCHRPLAPRRRDRSSHMALTMSRLAVTSA